MTLKVRAHNVGVIAWGIVGGHMIAGEQVDVTIGAHCDAGCKLKGAEVSLVDDETGKRVCHGQLDYYGGPLKTYWCVDLKARVPQEAGRHKWRVRIESFGSHPSAERTLPFSVVSAAPNGAVLVHVRDRKGKPLVGANIMVRVQGESPYRGVTDTSGDALVHVPEGIYSVTTSKNGFLSQTQRDLGIGTGEPLEVTFNLDIDYEMY